MTSWKLLLIWILPSLRAGDEGIYECGAHGRFEYCIDGIPGCVIGCHCHPGYYFDTETKICESNTKLTQNYRRAYLPQPTRVHNSNLVQDESEAETYHTLTTQNIIDEHVNDITKNADDLGDWLYNQFFKTIENQVINKTNKDPMTRRSERDSIAKHRKPKRRARKGERKKHRSKKKNMKEKLLRIAEDDSLFQSSSHSSESDTSSSDDSESHSFSGSDSDEGHGHRKILMINKKPKPPLPSFIFLPHMDTPFYPPIGLPPPPSLPMYPMVPVPPVMPPPPMLPYPCLIMECNENKTTTTSSSSNQNGSASTSPKPPTTQSQKPTTETPEPEEVSKGTPERSHTGRKRKKMKSFDTIPVEEGDVRHNNFNPERNNREKLLQHLRQRINNPGSNRNRGPLENYVNQLPPPNTPISNNNLEKEISKNKIPPLENVNEFPDYENVDFKYLSQLIHRVNESRDQGAPSEIYNVKSAPERFRSRELSIVRNGYINSLNSGRRIHQQLASQRNGQPDDSYYSNLGRQIATLIRTIDADKERQFNIEIEKVKQKSDNQPFFNENAPRTFWERSVRSPLKYIYPFKSRYDYLKNSNELLFNIENKVETLASTVRSLSLQEVENMIKIMETAPNQFESHTKMKNANPSFKTLNINLWPQEIKQPKNSIKSFLPRPDVSYVNIQKFSNYSKNTRPETLNTNPNKVPIQNLHPYADHHKLQNYSRLKLVIPQVIQTSTKLAVVTNRTEAKYLPEILQKASLLPVQIAKKPQYNLYPTAQKNRNVRKKYFFDDNNHYSFQNDNLPIQYSVRKVINKHTLKTPHFHHEINHLDYIKL